MLSHICDSFHCTIDQAEAMDFKKIQAVMEYRALIGARDQHNSDASKMTPDQMRIWREMTETLDG